MDIHGGKGVMLGPKNYLSASYESAPIGITVEGANIMTRSPNYIWSRCFSLPSLCFKGNSSSRRRRSK